MRPPDMEEEIQCKPHCMVHMFAGVDDGSRCDGGWWRRTSQYRGTNRYTQKARGCVTLLTMLLTQFILVCWQKRRSRKREHLRKQLPQWRKIWWVCNRACYRCCAVLCCITTATAVREWVLIVMYKFLHQIELEKYRASVVCLSKCNHQLRMIHR